MLSRVPIYFRYASLLFFLIGSVGCLMTFMPPPNAVVPSQAAGSTPETTYGAFEDDRQALINSNNSNGDNTDNTSESSDVEGVYKAVGHLKDIIEHDILGVLKDEFDREDELLRSSSTSASPRRNRSQQELVNTSEIDGQDGPIPPAAPKKNYFGVRKALRTRMALILFITFGLSTESSYFIGIMAKPFGQFIQDDKFLALIISVGNFANCIGGLICGRIMDRIKFKVCCGTISETL